MRILVSSHRYAPDVGGIETSSAQLVAQWRKLGHEVQIVTATAGPDEPQVHRRPSRATLWRLVCWAEVYWHNNISLQTAWPLLFVRRPWVVTTQTWLHDTNGHVGWSARLKRTLLRRAQNIYISSSVAQHVGQPGEIVPNPYDDTVFRLRPEISRDRELVFLGRLVSDKGVDVLIRALHRLVPQLRPRLTLIGRGPEENSLRKLSQELGVADQVTFAGGLSGDPLAAMLNAHRVLVVPSVWNEPFGIVALEGMACGCTVVASRNGGLPEATGAGGITFTTGSVEGLAAALRRVLESGTPDEAHRERIRAHLNAHRAETVAARYLRIFESARDKSA